jgi:hypothetical protein
MYVGDICVLLCRLLTLPVAEQVMLQSENYVTRRRSLKLLAEILLDRSNYTVMMRYISSKHNLKVKSQVFFCHVALLWLPPLQLRSHTDNNEPAAE